MNNLPQVFKYEENNVRIELIDNDPWFVAKDVCNVLGITKYRDAISRLDADERASVLVDTLGGKQRMSIINESGFYKLVFRSRKKIAKSFTKWVTSEVIPSIRKNGGYLTPNITEEQLKNLVAENHNLRIERDHFAVLAELNGDVADTWKSHVPYGTISKANGLPRKKRRRGTLVADPRGYVDDDINDTIRRFHPDLFKQSQPTIVINHYHIG